MSSSRARAQYVIGSKDGYRFLDNGEVGTIEHHDWKIGACNHKSVRNKKQLRKVLMKLRNAGCKEAEVDHLFSKREHGKFVTYMTIYDYHLEFYR